MFEVCSSGGNSTAGLIHLKSVELQKSMDQVIDPPSCRCRDNSSNAVDQAAAVQGEQAEQLHVQEAR